MPNRREARRSRTVPALSAGFGRGQSEEIDASLCEVSTQPGQRTDFVIERQIELSGFHCRHRFRSATKSDVLENRTVMCASSVRCTDTLPSCANET